MKNRKWIPLVIVLCLVALTIYAATFTGNVTLSGSTANTIIEANGSQSLVSVPNTAGNTALTNDGVGDFGWFPLASIAGGGTSITNSGLFYDITNGMTAANINTVFAAKTQFQTISFQPGDYNLSAQLFPTNGGYIQGNGATLHFTNATALLLTNYMLDTGTNFSRQITIRDLNFDGGNLIAAFNTTTYYDSNHLFANGFNGVTVWSNRTGMRIECSGGANIRNCRMYGWSGNAILLINTFDDTTPYRHARPIIEGNTLETNFCGIFVPGNRFEVPGYNNADSSLWADWEPNYNIIKGNHIDGCQVGIAEDAPNNVLLDNVCLNNFFGILQLSMSGSSLVMGNNLNHNSFSYSYNGAGFPQVIANMMVAPNIDSLLGINALALDFEFNQISGAIVVTNTGAGALSTGIIANNLLFPGTTWGGTMPVNITNNFFIYNNHSADGTNTDGSQLSSLVRSNSLPGMNYVKSGYFNAVTNTGSVTIVSNFAVANPNTYTNLSGGWVEAMVPVQCQAGTTTAGVSATASCSLNITNNGVGLPIENIQAQFPAIGTNVVGGVFTFALGPGDYFKVTTATVGNGSVVSFFNNTVFKLLP